MILIRFALVSLIVYLIVRSFLKLGEEKVPSKRRSEPEKENKISSKRVSKKIGEYVDYEDITKQNS
jgi:hypothetical protein